MRGLSRSSGLLVLLLAACGPPRAEPSTTGSSAAGETGEEPSTGAETATGASDTSPGTDTTGDRGDGDGEPDDSDDTADPPPDLAPAPECSGGIPGRCTGSLLDYTVLPCEGMTGLPCGVVGVGFVDGVPTPNLSSSEDALDCVLTAFAARSPGNLWVRYSDAPNNWSRVYQPLADDRMQFVGEAPGGDSCEWGVHSLRPPEFFEGCLALSFADKLACLDDWKLDPECEPTYASACAPNTCGNGNREAWEACDGSEMPYTCADFGFIRGTVLCDECQLDPSECML